MDDKEDDLNNRENLIQNSLENVYALTEVGGAITDSNSNIACLTDSSNNISLPLNDSNESNENNEKENDLRDCLDQKTSEIIGEANAMNEFTEINFENIEDMPKEQCAEDEINDAQKEGVDELEKSGTAVDEKYIFSSVDQNVNFDNEGNTSAPEDSFSDYQKPIDINDNISHKAATAPETQPATSLFQSPSESPRKIHTLYSDPIDFSELQPLETTPELDSLCKQQMKQFMHKSALPESSQQQRLIQYVQRQKVNAIVSNNYKEAAKLQTTFQNLLSLINETQQRESLQTKTKEIMKKIDEVNEKIEDVKYETESVIANEKNRLNLKKEDILNQHHFDLMQFEGKWNDEEYLRRFTKPSSQLLKKQTLLHSFILMKNFEKAEELRLEIEAMEISESETAQKRAEFEMSKEQIKIIQKQQNEIETFDDYCQRQIEMITRDQEAKMTPLLARQKKLESELTYLKNAKVSAISPLPTLQTASAPASSLDHVMTPRTVQRYSSYKTQVRNPRLTVKPLGAIIKSKKTNNYK